jgi:transcriptional regulator with XRE-family HTH domain
MELHEKVKSTRDMRGLTIVAMAKHLCISEGYVRQMEVGSRPIPPAILRSIAIKLDIPIEYYMNTDNISFSEFIEKHKFMSDKYDECKGYVRVINKAKESSITEEELDKFVQPLDLLFPVVHSINNSVHNCLLSNICSINIVHFTT